jgi:hypothetical protein
VVTINWIPILDMHKTRLVVKSGHRKFMAQDEIGICAQNLETDPDPKNWKAFVIT